jgi:putative hemolysin
MEPAVIFAILALIFASGFFSLCKQALRASRTQRLRKEALAGSTKYRRALEAAEDPRILYAAARLWICLTRILAAVLTGFSVAPYPSVPAVLASTAALSLAVISLGSLFPRLAAHAAPERITAALLPLWGVFALPLNPLYRIARRFGAFLRPLLQADRRQGITEDELRLALMEGEKSGIVASRERTMVEGVFYLGDRPVGAFMTHRSEIQWLDANATAEDIRAKALEHRAQRCFPVADRTTDAIIGAAYLEDIIFDQTLASPRGLRAIMKKAQFIPETMPAIKAFESFKRGDANFLFVMDEYGGFAGIISVMDLVEEIVGELTAPRGEAEPVIRQEDGSWLADGSVNIDEAAEILALPGLAAEHGGWHTLAGFVLSLAGELPQTGESFTYQGYRFTVVDMDGNRIDKLLIRRE